MEYQVRAYGQVQATFHDKEEAIEAAKKCTSPDSCVFAHEVSGTYESRTCIWPTKGETYSN